MKNLTLKVEIEEVKKVLPTDVCRKLDEVYFEGPLQVTIVGDMVKVNCSSCGCEDFNPDGDKKRLICCLTSIKLGTKADYNANGRFCPIAAALEAGFHA